MIYRRNKVFDGTIKMSDTEEYSLQNKTGTINITTVNVDKIHFKNLLIVSASLKRETVRLGVIPAKQEKADCLHKQQRI
jgi:hypothetical protein